VEAASVPWRPLGELFVGRGLITETELETALAEQAATGKRLGEILVKGGFISGPDLTAALMDQLGVEISKEEGYGSGLWAEIKRRHKRVRPDDDPDAEGEDDVEAEAETPEIALVPPIDEPTPDPETFEPEAFPPESAFEAFESDTFVLEAVVEPEVFAQSEPVIEFEPIAVAPEIEQELAEIAADYQPPAEREPRPEPVAEEPELVAELEPVAEGPEPVAGEPESEEEPELEAAAEFVEPESEAEPEQEPEHEPGLEVASIAAESEDAAALRAELADARADLAHLQEMLADAMTALAALSAEAAGEPYAETE